jgi:hypothetical protein
MNRVDLSPAVRIENLRKFYTVRSREPGVVAAFRSLVRRRMEKIEALGGHSCASPIFPRTVTGRELNQSSN